MQLILTLLISQPDKYCLECRHQNDNRADRAADQLWDKEKSILLQKVAKLLDSRKREGRVEETQASQQPITQDQPAQHFHQVIFKSTAG